MRGELLYVPLGGAIIVIKRDEGVKLGMEWEEGGGTDDS